MQNFEKIKSLGDGAYGAAVLCRHVTSRRLVVVKEVKLAELDKQARVDAMRESEILKGLNHPNIIRYIDSGMTPSRVLWIAMEHATKGDLYDFLQSRKTQGQGRYLPLVEVLGMFSQLCLAMRYLHRHNILHRDLKSKNVFLGNPIMRDNLPVQTVKLGDFGIAKVLSCTVALARTQIGTPYYMSPEICKDEAYGRKSDVWAMGCLFYEMMALEVPYHGRDLARLAMSILRRPVPQLPKTYRSNGMLVAVLSALLEKDPNNRPSVEQTCEVSLLESELEFWSKAPSTPAWPSDSAEPQDTLANAAAKSKRRRRLPSVPAVLKAATELATAATVVVQCPVLPAVHGTGNVSPGRPKKKQQSSPTRQQNSRSPRRLHANSKLEPSNDSESVHVEEQYANLSVKGLGPSPSSPTRNGSKQHLQINSRKTPRNFVPPKAPSPVGHSHEAVQSYIQARTQAQRNRVAVEQDLGRAQPGPRPNGHPAIVAIPSSGRYNTPTPHEESEENLTPVEKMKIRKAQRLEEERLQRIKELEAHRRQLAAERNNSGLQHPVQQSNMSNNVQLEKQIQQSRAPLASENGRADDNITPAERMRHRKAARLAAEMRAKAEMLEAARKQTFDDRLNLHRKLMSNEIDKVQSGQALSATRVIEFG